MQDSHSTLHLSPFINLRTDYGFKRIFGTAKNKHLLIRLLNALMGEKIKITDVKFHDKELLPAEEKGKRIIYDVYCTSLIEDTPEPFGKLRRLIHDDMFSCNEKVKREHHFILEMQNQYEPPLEDRVLYYTAKPIASQGVRGWNYHLDPVVTIVVTNFDFPLITRRLVRNMAMADLETGEQFSDKMRIILLSLEQIKKKRWDECKTEIEQILYLIKNMDKLDKNSKAFKGQQYDDFFEAAETASMASDETVAYSQSLQKLKATEEGIEYASLIARAKGMEEGMQKGWKKGMRKGMQEGIEKGMQEGIEKGMQEGIEKERIKSMSLMQNMGIPTARIAEVYGISESEVKNILKSS